jgi:hypothetical protein
MCLPVLYLFAISNYHSVSFYTQRPFGSFRRIIIIKVVLSIVPVMLVYIDLINEFEGKNEIKDFSSQKVIIRRSAGRPI